jgi:amino acid transporter
MVGLLQAVVSLHALSCHGFGFKGGRIGMFDASFWDQFLRGFIGTLAFGLLGILLALLGFKAFDWITPGIDLQKELAEKHNLAVAIVCAAVILGICYIVATAVM